MKIRICPTLLWFLWLSECAFGLTISVIGPTPPDEPVSHTQCGSSGVQFMSSRSCQYRVEFSEDLQTWSVMDEEVFGSGGTLSFNNPTNVSRRGFYRIQWNEEFTFTINPACFVVDEEWIYQITEEDIFSGTSTSRIQREYVVELQPQNGYDVIGLRKEDEAGQLVELECILNDFSNGIFLVGYMDSERQKTYFDPPEPVEINRFIPGEESGPVPVDPPEPGFSETEVTTSVWIEYGTVSVPAGSFDDTVRVESRMTGTYTEQGFSVDFIWESETWYSKEVGQVKSVSTLYFDGFGDMMIETSVLTSCSLL